MWPWPLSIIANRFSFLTDHPLSSTAVLALNFVFAIPASTSRFWEIMALGLLTLGAISAIWLFRFSSDRSSEISGRSFFKGDYYLGRVDVPSWLSSAVGYSGLFLVLFILWSLYWDAVGVYRIVAFR
jgi:hypothetical protein